MEANIPLRYQGSSDNVNVLLAHLACVCDNPCEENCDEPCKNDEIVFDQKFECVDVLTSSQDITSCKVDTNQLDVCGITLEQDDKTISMKGAVSLLSTNGRYDCPYIYDEDDYVNVIVNVNLDLRLPGAGDTIFDFNGQQYTVHHTCVKRK